jgi:hypothetical protein
MILATYEKQPAEYKDYDIDYSQWLTPADDVINTVTATVTSATQTSPTLAVNLIQNTVYVTKLWVTGGTVNTKYKITVRMTSDGGRIDESELIFNIKDR